MTAPSGSDARERAERLCEDDGTELHEFDDPAGGTFLACDDCGWSWPIEEFAAVAALDGEVG